MDAIGRIIFQSSVIHDGQRSNTTLDNRAIVG
jgi:hypothetical protein